MKTRHIRFLIAGLLISQAIYSQKDYSEVILSLARPYFLPQNNNDLQIRQVSSYDTTGGNDDGFSGRYSYLRKEGNNLVIADLKGPGTIRRMWTPTPTEDTIQFWFDGEKEPRINIKFIELFNGKVYPFVRPVAGNEVGGYYCYLPVPFLKSCRIILKGKVMQFIQIDYVISAGSEVPAASFPKKLSPGEMESLAFVVDVWKSTGKKVIDLTGNKEGGIRATRSSVTLRPGETVSIFTDNDGGRLIGFEIEPQSDFNASFKDVLLKAVWDDEPVPAIYCPLTDFFGYAFGKPSMQSMLLGVNDRLHYCFIPMPYRKNASLELVCLKNDNFSQKNVTCNVTVYSGESKLRPDEGKFYAWWNRDRNIATGKPHTILDTKGRGQYIGTLLQSQGLNSGMTLFFEGDDECYIDGQLRLHGTGSEDYFNGGWYALPDRWDQAFSLPVHGSLEYSVPLARTGGYRFYVSDKLPFKESFKLTIEHGGTGNSVPADYTSVAFFYSDRPLPENPAPSYDLLEAVKSPDLLEYWLQLLSVLAFSEQSQIIKENLADTKSKKNYEVLKFSATEEGFIKFSLDVPGDGDYNLYISYFKGKNCSDFQVNQRQIPLKIISGFAPENTFVEKEPVGKISIKSGTNTISLTLKGNKDRKTIKSIFVHRLYLERL